VTEDTPSRDPTSQVPIGGCNWESIKKCMSLNDVHAYEKNISNVPYWNMPITIMTISLSIGRLSAFIKHIFLILSQS